MKQFVHILAVILLGISLSSCIVESDPYYHDGSSLEQLMTNYDIWYVDYNRTTGYGNVPFVSRAFTLSFQNGRVFANNNIVGIGYTGNGYGIQIGTYDTYSGYLRVNHSTEGFYDFEVYADSPQSIRIHEPYEGVTYYLEGYHKNYFDFDQVFYDNIEYFLQEYYAWEKTYTSDYGEPNVFDYENYLAFTPENITTFYSSQDVQGTPLNDIYWDYTGSYEVYNVAGYDNLKILKLFYAPSGYEEFELSVINDGAIELFHVSSGTLYEFDGRSFIQYRLSNSKTEKKNYEGRSRIKVNRKTVERHPEATEKRSKHPARK
jgi:hypothetical protein